jgi:4-hydroxythreonine-4-phosphate dehydrogenase
VVVGTAEPSADEQIRRLGVPVLEVGATPDLAAGPAVLRLRGPFDPSFALPDDADLVLTGGETARRVLDALGVTQLQPVAVIHYGAVQSRAPDGRTIVTRPGSFGGPDSLVQIVRALT